MPEPFDYPIEPHTRVLSPSGWRIPATGLAAR
jgi:hypothetical protein